MLETYLPSLEVRSQRLETHFAVLERGACPLECVCNSLAAAVPE